MPKFFMPIPDQAKQIILTGENAHHLGYALRSKVGDAVTVCNTDAAASTYGWDYCCTIAAFDPQTVTLDVEAIKPSEVESPVSITLYQAVPKGDKLDTILQKTVELGVNRVVPVITKRCISRPDPKSQAKKKERLSKIAQEAAKQCGRSILPQVSDYLSFEQALRDSEGCDCRILCYEGGGIRLSEAISDKVTSIALFIGSEGGFAPEEVEAAKAAGVISCTLGKLILRCETAPITAVSILRFLTGDI